MNPVLHFLLDALVVLAGLGALLVIVVVTLATASETLRTTFGWRPRALRGRLDRKAAARRPGPAPTPHHGPRL